MEREASRMPTLREVAYPGLEIHEEDQALPVGMIVYNGGKKALSLFEEIGSDGTSLLKIGKSELNDQWNYKAAVKTSERVQDMSKYENVIVAQVGMERVRIRTHPSATSWPSVSIQIPFIDPESKKTHYFPADEEDVLRAFRTTEGKLLVFKGAGFPEENALILEKEWYGKQTAFVFFFHPDQAGVGLESYDGLLTFLRKLGSEFEVVSNSPVQQEAIDALSKDRKAGRVPSSSELRNQMFRMMVIAHARQVAKNGSTDSEKFLKTFLPSFRTNRFFPRRLKANEVSTIIDELVYDNAPILKQEEQVLRDEDNRVIFKSPEVRALRVGIGGAFGSHNRAMETYVSKVYDLGMNTNNPIVAEDAVSAIREVIDSKCFVGLASYDWYPQNKNSRLKFFPFMEGASITTFNRLLASLESSLLEKERSLYYLQESKEVT